MIGAVYISTEDVFPTRRLQQLTTSFSQQHSLSAKHFSDNIFVEHVATIVSLDSTLYSGCLHSSHEHCYMYI